MEDKNLTRQIAALPAELAAAISRLQTTARNQDCRIYLVGGAVRDLLLGLPARDVDVVVLGDAITLAKTSVPSLGKLTAHPAFGTATIISGSTRLDLSSARTESYARPGALPTVRSGTLEDDLRRRDFTVNAMAISLNTEDNGHLVDYCGGQADLAARFIRTLHPRSFTDDPTRIWRAARYEQRLGFTIEPSTLKQLMDNIPGLKNITGDRIRYELMCLLQEDAPEETLARLNGLGALKMLPSAPLADSWLAEKFQETRTSVRTPFAIYLGLITYRMNSNKALLFADYLSLSKPLRRTLQDIQIIKTKLPVLSRPGLQPSTVYHHLHGCAPEASETVRVACTSHEARRNIALYKNTLRKVMTALTGSDFVTLGVPPGPRVGELLQQLLKARLNGQVKSRADELALAKTLISRQSLISRTPAPQQETPGIQKGHRKPSRPQPDSCAN